MFGQSYPFARMRKTFLVSAKNGAADSKGEHRGSNKLAALFRNHHQFIISLFWKHRTM